jgi:hypothetical protein
MIIDEHKTKAMKEEGIVMRQHLIWLEDEVE